MLHELAIYLFQMSTRWVFGKAHCILAQVRQEHFTWILVFAIQDCNPLVITDACPLTIFMMQLEKCRLDPITTINISPRLLSFAHLVFLSNNIPWKIETSNSPICCMRVLTFTITLLCNCSKIDLRTIEKQSTSTKLSKSFWQEIRRNQVNALRKGIQFLSYLARREPDFISSFTDIEDSFHLFMQRIDAFDDLILHENERKIFL